MRQSSMLHVGLILAIYAHGAVAQEEEVFEYEFHGTDVLKWTEDDTPIGDDTGVAAAALKDLLVNAESSADFALYGVRQQSWFLDAVRTLKRQAVPMRFVLDQSSGALGDWRPENFDYADTSILARLLPNALLQVDVGPGRGTDELVARAGSIMHNKFAVVDSKAVWFGSANVSNTCLGSEYNANNSIIVRSPGLAKVFANEFNQMFRDKLFSIYKTRSRRSQTVHYSDGTEVNVFFSPQDEPLFSAVIPFIRSARRTLDIGMFFLTGRPLADELIQAAERGVKVRILYDAVAARHSSSQHKYLRENGVEVLIENFGGKMHMKTAVADGRHTLIGSMNWSEAGTNANDENVVVVKDNRRLAGDTLRYFNRLWQAVWTSTELLRARGFDPRPEGPDSIHSCTDGIDNDHDDSIDSEDPGCGMLGTQNSLTHLDG